jgi:nickel-dependent lactate racemase
MMRFSVPYADQTLQIEVEEKYIFDIIHPAACRARGNRRILKNALANPLGNETLADFVRNADKVNVIVNDGARPTQTAAVISVIDDIINAGDLNFVVATGAHRAPTEQELRQIFGTHYDQYKEQIVVHDARDDSVLDYYGKTRYGNAMWLNRVIAKNNKTVVIGSIEPHYFAGYTGGRKAFLPGIAGYRTIEKNHGLTLHARAKPLILDGNPVHEEMLDCINALGKRRIFSIQLIMDRNHNIHNAYTGPIIRTFEIATNEARQIFTARIARKADIVVTVAQPPFDIDLYQTLKAIEHGRLATNEGGILIIVSPCKQGLGPASFARLFEKEDSMERSARKARSQYRLGDHNAYNLMSLRRQFQIWAVTEINQKTLSTGGIRKFPSLQDALDQAIRQKEKKQCVLFLMNGSLSVPEIRQY